MASKDSVTTSDEGPFRFMDLPREIRDAVYDELVVDISIAHKIVCRPITSGWGLFHKPAAVPYPDREASFTLKNAPVVSCFAVSYQFSREYKESLERNHPTTTLKMTDRNDGCPEAPIIPKQEMLPHIQNFELELLAECDDFAIYDFEPSHLDFCGCWRQMRIHVRNLVYNYATLISSIGSCQLLLCIRGPRKMGGESTAELEDTLKPLAQMTGMRSIKVLHFPDHITGDGKDVLHCYEPESGPFASWTPGEKWMHREVEAVPWKQVVEVKNASREKPIWADERSN